LFGSRARGAARGDSDIDLAVLAPGCDLLQLSAEVSMATGKSVDVVSLERPTIPLLEQIIRDGEVLHEGSPGRAAAWWSCALAMLETDRPWYTRMSDAWLRRVAREGL
jgi:hypothetical protein